MENRWLEEGLAAEIARLWQMVDGSANSPAIDNRCDDIIRTHDSRRDRQNFTTLPL
jgi:hypothetical protein